jgi:GTP cyclohydrolase I
MVLGCISFIRVILYFKITFDKKLIIFPKNKPKASTFDNKYNYSEMLVEKDITLYSTCEHHFLPIVGKAHIAYISSGNVIGLSKMNRIVEYYAKRPQ